jgi:hypothetical protein
MPSPDRRKKKAQCAQHWTQRLSHKIREDVLDRVYADGYEGDVDAWVADLLATAARSPQGYLLRVKRKRAGGYLPEDTPDLFTPAEEAEQG